MRIAVDLDDVLAEFVPEVLKRWNSNGVRRQVALEHMTSWESLWQQTTGAVDTFWEWIKAEHPDIYAELPGPGRLSWTRLMDLWVSGHQIVYVTSRYPEHAVQTYQWLTDKGLAFEGFELHFTDDKTTVLADVYIDDAPHHLKELVVKRPDALVLRWKRPWNTDSPGVPVDDWEQVVELVEQHEATLLTPKVDFKAQDYEKLVEVRQTSDSGGQKGIKLEQLGAIDPLALQVLGRVAGFGAQKYDTFNFAKGYPWSWSFNALFRHLLAWLNGEELDPESGLPHLGHAMWHCATLLTLTLRERGTDDRIGSVLKDGEAA